MRVLNRDFWEAVHLTSFRVPVVVGNDAVSIDTVHVNSDKIPVAQIFCCVTDVDLVTGHRRFTVSLMSLCLAGTPTGMHNARRFVWPRTECFVNAR